jgi:dCMP deaminase
MISLKELDYLSFASDLANRFSRDNSTKVGAIILNPNTLHILSTGYNGFPRKVLETKDRMERPLKYVYTEHAERNAIYGAARQGHSLDGSLMICTMFPCHDCARAIIQSGIMRIISYKPNNERWAESNGHSLTMFNEAGIIVDLVGI